MDRWAHLGHTLGECWVDTDIGITHVHIPKNASSFIKGCLLLSQKFRHSDVLIKNDRYLVALRDPIERWISGISQYEFNSKDIKIPYEQITVDDHTEQQCYFLQDVDLDKCDFIMVNDNFRSNLQVWFDRYGYTIDITHLQQLNSSQNDGRRYLKQKYKMIIDNDPEFLLKLTDHYANDYALINRVKFYGN